MERKINNGDTLVCKNNCYNFTKIVILRKAKSSKKNPENMYLCDVWLKDSDTPSMWYITESRLLDISDNL